jgi:hypothetical protein
MDITSTLENGSQASYSSAADPFKLSSKLKPTDEGQRAEANTSRKRTPRYNPFGKKDSQLRGVTEFYNSQNEKIKSLLKPVDEHVREHARPQRPTSCNIESPYTPLLYATYFFRAYNSMEPLPLALSPSSQRWPTRSSTRYQTSL